MKVVCVFMKDNTVFYSQSKIRELKMKKKKNIALWCSHCALLQYMKETQIWSLSNLKMQIAKICSDVISLI